MRSKIFTDLYKELEDTLESKYSGQKRRYSSVIFEYINSAESKPIRDELNLCREVRNLLTHNADLGGVPVVEPSEPLVEALQKALEYVRRPPLALDFATSGGKIYSAGLSSRVLAVMADMEKNGFSHVPIIEGKRFVGVFSISTIFACVLHDPTLNITERTTMRELGQMLPLENHKENFVFVSRETTCAAVRQMFERISGRNKRLSVVFITEHGSKEEKLLGMVTPWDVMREE